MDRLGRPVRDLRISVTDRCNFRCGYCMPKEVFGEHYEFLPRDAILTFEEIERLAGLFCGLGVRKLRLTGGEPTLRAELERLVARLARVKGVEDLGLTTNGYLLESLAAPLREAGLRRITVSLDSLDPAVFARMNGLGHGVGRVLRGIEAAEAAGFRPLKINCVVQRGVNDGTIVDLAMRFRGTGHIVRFIEFMDVGTRNGWEMSKVVTGREIAERIGAVAPLRRAPPQYPGEVATRWLYEDGSGEIGIITSVSEPFCRGCTRARLTTDGKLVTCLFATSGTDLLGPMRAGASDADLRRIVEAVWLAREDRYSEERTRESAAGAGRRIEMFRLGG
jgi:cyclic pyranopterin phosphate synthase